MNKLDIRKEYESYYKANEYPEVVEIFEASYVSILGNGSPGTDDFYEKKKELKVLLEGIENRYSETEKSFTSSVVEIFYWYDEQQTGFVNIGEFYTKVDLSLLHYRIAIRIQSMCPNKISWKSHKILYQRNLHSGLNISLIPLENPFNYYTWVLLLENWKHFPFYKILHQKEA